MSDVFAHDLPYDALPALAHVHVHFCAHLDKVFCVGVAGAWCGSGRADDSVGSLMHGHTM